MRFWPNWERRKDELHEEIESHLRMAVEDRVSRGESPVEARAAALREMGNPPLVADVTRAQWGWQWLERIAQDLRYAVRQLIKTPGYTATALITLTLAIGANTAIFALLYALMLRSLPVAQPDRIVQFELQIGAPGKDKKPSSNVSGKVYDVLAAAHPASLSGLCAWSKFPPLNLHDENGTRPAQTAQLTGDCFQTLGLHAALGRLFTEADDKPGGGPEGYPVVLSNAYWRSHYAGDPGVLGRVLDFQGKKGVIIGVLQPGFESVMVGDTPAMYLPSEVGDPYSRHGFGSYNRILLGRMTDGATPAQVLAQTDPVLQAAFKAENFSYYQFDNGKMTKANSSHLLVVPGRTGMSYLRMSYAQPLYLIEGMVGLSLLVACAYLAMLSGTRALSRRRELAVRVALGASRGRLTAQLCCESLLLSAAGMALGLLFAWGASRSLVSLLGRPGDEPLSVNTAPTGMVLVFALSVTGLAVLLSGVIPAWRASRVDPAREIKEGELTHAGRRPRSAGSWLAPLQMGLSLVIVTIAALMATTLVRLLSINPGFSTSGVTFTRADFFTNAKPAPSGQPKPDANKPKEDNRRPASLYLALLDRIRSAPGVESASLTQMEQFSGMLYMSQASSTLPSGERRVQESIMDLTVAPDYFRTMGIPMMQGRDFTANDKGDAPQVCILTKSAAEYFFPGQNAVGQMINLGTDATDPKSRVIGVVGDTLFLGYRDEKRPAIYTPFLASLQNQYLSFAVRSRSAVAGEAAVRQAFKEVAPDVPLYETVTVGQLVGSTVGRERMVALLSGFFALLTLALSAIGMYGLLNSSVLRRRREIGVRMALGASQAGVIRLVLREALWLVVPGLILGAAGAWGATRFVRSLLYGVKPLDPWVLAASAAALLVTAALACLLPARRAASVHPMEALRAE
jgi:predicted permease